MLLIPLQVYKQGRALIDNEHALFIGICTVQLLQNHLAHSFDEVGCSPEIRCNSFMQEGEFIVGRNRGQLPQLLVMFPIWMQMLVPAIAKQPRCDHSRIGELLSTEVLWVKVCNKV